MLTREKLLALYREHRSDPVLSVYINSDQHDPASRDAWRIRLDQNLSEIRSQLAHASADAADQFESAAALVRKAIGVDGDAFLPGRGWVGFATSERVLYSERLPVPMPDLVRWELGIRVAPYVRALKQNRAVFLVMLDSREARLYRYRQGELQQLEDFQADTDFGDLTDIGTGKRATQRSGVRGQTGTDAARISLDVAANRLVARISERLESESTAGRLVIGGVPERVSALESALSAFGERMITRPSLHLGMKASELAPEVEAAASALTRRLHQGLLERVVESAAPGGKGCLGRNETERALREERVRAVLVSEGLAARDPDYADRLIGTAFGSSGGDAHLIAGEAGERLDIDGEGVGALLHYGREA